MDRIVHESVLTNTSDEKVNALMYQASHTGRREALMRMLTTGYYSPSLQR